MNFLLSSNLVGLIIRDLTELKQKQHMNAHMTVEQRALARAIDKLTEGSLALCVCECSR